MACKNGTCGLRRPAQQPARQSGRPVSSGRPVTNVATRRREAAPMVQQPIARQMNTQPIAQQMNPQRMTQTTMQPIANRPMQQQLSQPTQNIQQAQPTGNVMQNVAQNRPQVPLSRKAQKSAQKASKKQQKATQKQQKSQQRAAQKQAQQPTNGPIYADSPQMLNAPKTSFWSGSKGGVQNYPLYEKGQNESLNNLLSRGNQMLENPEQSPAYQQAQKFYNRVITPSIANRFTALGSGRNSSSFKHAIAGAGQELSENLPGIVQQQALPFLQMGLQQKYGQVQHQPKSGALSTLGKAGLQAAGGAIQGGLTGGWGGAVAGGLGGFASGLSGAGGGSSTGGGGGGYSGGGQGQQIQQLRHAVGGVQVSQGGQQQDLQSLLGDEGIQALIDALVGNEDIKKTLLAGG